MNRQTHPEFVLITGGIMLEPEDRADEVAEVVHFEIIADHVALVTLDRPHKRNAVNVALANELDACVKRSEADPNIRVVILTSSNDAVFCAGADLAEVAAGNGPRLFTTDGGFGGFIDAKRRKPWIAAANGAVMAGGMEICLACDMIVAGEGSAFSLPEVKRSFIATEGGVTRLTKAIPRAVALELIATGDPIDARRAYEVGLINRVVPREQVLDAAIALAKAVAVNAPLAVYEALQVAKASAVLGDEDSSRLAKAALERLRATEDFKEGPKAFLQKRPARWQGR
jgi:enoyl-CoA hydratase/carnithine racemase